MSRNVVNIFQTFYDSTGNPRSGGFVTFFENTTTTLASIFSDEDLIVAQANPYTLDAHGRIVGDVKYEGLLTLKITNSDLSDVRTDDNVSSTRLFVPPGNPVFSTASSMVALVAITGQADGDQVSMESFYAGIIGGGGTFTWKAAASKTTHDGGTIIDPDIGVTPGASGWWTAPGSGTGVWARVFGTQTNVRWFGAVGDGAADDYEALNSAFNVGEAISKEIAVYIPAGVYKVTSTFDFDSIRVPSIVGDSSISTVIIASGFTSATPIIKIQRTSGTRVLGIRWQGFTLRDDTGNAHGIDAEWLARSKLEDVTFHGLKIGFNGIDTIFSCHFDSVKTSVPAGEAVVLRDESNALLFSNCIFGGVTTSVRLLGSTNAVKFNNCDFEGGASYHLDVQPVTGKVVKGLSIDTCYFENGADASISFNGIDADSVHGFSVQNSYFTVQPATVAGAIILRNCKKGYFFGNSFNRYTSFVFNRGASHTLINIGNNDYDAPALSNFGDVFSATEYTDIYNNSTGRSRTAGAGSPEGVVFAVVGSEFLRTDGGAGTTYYVKESGGGSSGWIAK